MRGTAKDRSVRYSPLTLHPSPLTFSSMIWLVAAGSALGGVLRFLMVPWAQRYAAQGFPGGTLAVNILGSFVIGAVLRLANAEHISPETRVFLTVGVCGGFTTFSAFSAESLELMQSGQWLRAGLYVSASVLLCIGAAGLGWAGAGLFGSRVAH